MANFSRSSKFPHESQNDESGTAYRAAESSERRRTARQNGRGIIVRSTWRWLLSETRQVAALQFFIEKSGNLEGSRPLRRVVHRRRSPSDERIALGGSPFKTIA
jgi:hypothetical protein